MKIQFLALITTFIVLTSACSQASPAADPISSNLAAGEAQEAGSTPNSTSAGEATGLHQAPSPTSPIAVNQLPASTALSPQNIDQLAQLYDYSDDLAMAAGGSYLDLTVNHVHLSTDGTRLAFTICSVNSSAFICSDSGKGVVIVMDAGGSLVQRIEFGEVRVAAALLSPDGSTVYSLQTDVSSQTQIQAWDVATGTLAATVHLAPGRMNIRPSMCLSPDGVTLAALLGPQGLRVLSLSDGGVLFEAQGVFSRCAFSQDGQRLMVLERNANLEEAGFMAVDISNGETLLRQPILDPAQGMAIAPDGRLAAVSHAGGIDLWDLELGSVFQSLSAPSGMDWVFGPLAFNPDGSLLLGGIRDEGPGFSHLASAWETTGWTRVADLSGITPGLRDIQFSASGENLVFVDEFGAPTLHGLPDPLLAEAQAVMLAYMTALASGDYAAAADLYMNNPSSMDDPSEWIRTMGGDPEDMSFTFELACAPDALPCLPVKDVLSKGYDYSGQITFIVTLQTPGGETYVDEYGGSDVWLSAMVDADGQVKMVSLHPGSFVQ